MGSNVTVVRERDGSFKMSFISGSVINVPGEPGARIISPPCGDGKSTMIKKIMSEYFPYGVLVSVGTIEEAEDYANYVRENIVGKESFGVRMTNERLIVLHSGNEDKHAEYIYSSNPVEIMDKYIVICTHHKLLNNDPTILTHVSNKFTMVKIEEATSPRALDPKDIRNLYGGFRALQSLGSSLFYGPSPIRMIGPDGVPRRQFILIDEMPKCRSLRWTISRSDIFSMMNVTRIDNNIYRNIDIPNEDGGVVRTTVLEEFRPETYIINPCTDFNLAMGRYNTFVKGTSSDPIRGTRAIDDINRWFMVEALCLSILNNPAITGYGQPILGAEVPENLNICYNLSTLINGPIYTRLWVFDGTGDLAFYGIKNFDLCVPGKYWWYPKYSSEITFNRIHLSSSRLFNETTLFNNTDRLIDAIDENITQLMLLFCKSPNSKFLIVTWKTLNFRKRSVSGRYMTSNGIEKYISINDNGSKLNLVDYYQDRFDQIVSQAKSSGKLGPDFEVSVIYYQSGLDRATNKYREYDSVVLMGKFMVPYSAIAEHNLLTGANTDLVRYTIQGLAQAICRTRIRNHRHEPITVYYSDDWDERIIRLTNLYMNSSPNKSREALINSNSGYSGDDLLSDDFMRSIPELNVPDTNKFGLYSIRPSWRRKIGPILDKYPEVSEAIMTGSELTIDIPLNEMYAMIPMAKKERSRYGGIVQSLKELGVTLNIT